MQEKKHKLDEATVKSLVSQSFHHRDQAHALIDAAQAGCTHRDQKGQPTISSGYPIPPGDEHCSSCFLPLEYFKDEL